jgi:hypothetical protein
MEPPRFDRKLPQMIRKEHYERMNGALPIGHFERGQGAGNYGRERTDKRPIQNLIRRFFWKFGQRTA